MQTPLEPVAQAPFTLVLGLGESGAAVVRWCARTGGALRVADSRAAPAGIEVLREVAPHAEFRLGEAALLERDGERCFDPDLLAGVERVVISPGLPPHAAPARELVAAARERGIPVIGEIELFAQALADLAATRSYAPRVLAVTGTNGKTTVCALAGRLVEAAGRSVGVAGNIGPAALTALMAALEEDRLPEVWVLELSSFQLETTSTLKPHAGAVLNLTQDHLDWHGDMQAYGAAKARLLAASATAIVNRDDPAVAAMVDRLDGERVRSFGRETPVSTGDLGLDHSHGVAWLAEAAADDFEAPPVKRKKGEVVTRPEGRVNRLMPVDALHIRGVHNALNVQAALLLARSLGLPWAPLLRAVSEYRGEPHRVEFLRSIAGVDFIDDSKGTNVGATVAALEGLGQRCVLIAGGVGKGQDFSPLARAVALHARAVVLIGRDAPAIAEALGASGVPLEQSPDLGAAVNAAMARAEPGDAVLLSPACASFDMFRDYKHRADVFADAVQTLAADRGEV
ncbi:UDP-N-acetylmuramoyl-L-alanine--D-glutamate ligase [Pigmentiphaga sp. NML080357]|uniref:UDP-N-acetylmuramoyl-L-alanine--D-glutamate ligase n=1 Tax=Pigmentiphaga sp. NML080357 TaxID=2008675 RepID=UPI000B40ECE0|nr:UDP-N-acetylmuramoyl-L-alanine--D-glutamate ligase [Pigmentiphaga sp. NML080357]OVZ56669.1 UDP-N-acetylmuramoyl-L-alanine--D-glutamate ligase [Pigmentiphaga sp. NML080357]